MELNNFLTLIQLAAGLNAACIVVGISQGYTYILLNKIFNIKQQIDAKFDPIKATIKINQETLNHIEPSKVNEKNTYTKIEKVKRGYEVLHGKISKIEKEIKNNANLRCEFRCFSGLSLMMFLYCCTLLFIAPFYSNWFLLTFTTVVLFHSIIGWCAENIKYVCNLIWVIFEFIIALILSTIVYFFCDFIYIVELSVALRISLIIISALLPMVNFVIFFLKSFLKMKDINTHICTSAKTIETEGNEIHKNFELLQSLEQLKMDI